MRPNAASAPLWIAVFLFVFPWPGRSLAAPTVAITIESSPPGAAVYADGKEQGLRGYAASDFKVRLTHGPHRILLELAGYKPLEQTINISRAQKFLFTLDRAPARLRVATPVSSDAAVGGQLFIDGTPAGTVPAQTELGPGTHLVEVHKDGFKDFSQSVTLAAAEERVVLVTLQEVQKVGSLLIAASAGEVYVDGRPQGPAPVLVEQLREGDHVVEVRRTDAPDAPPFQKTVQVVAGQQTRVLAQLADVVKTGTLLVLGPDGAEVIIDGTARAAANAPIPELRAGDHVLVVQGKGYKPLTRVVTIETGKQHVEKVDLEKSDEARGVARLRVIMVNPVDGAQYFVNGRRLDPDRLLSDQGIEVGAGTNIIVVRKDNFGQVQKSVTIAPGASEVVSLELRDVGRVLVTSQPRGAQVLIDGTMVGQTPFTIEDVPGGPHMVELRLPEFEPYVQQVLVRGGTQANVNAQLVLVPIRSAPGGYLAEQRMQSSFSAVTNLPGRFTVDFATGYPYLLDLRLTVGAMQRGMFGLDVGAEVRTTFYSTDVNLLVRGQLFRAGPLAGGVQLLIGGGGGPRDRNDFVFEAGVPLTLIAGSRIHLTFKPFLQVYSDRLCPSASELQTMVQNGDTQDVIALGLPEQSADRCTGQPDEFSPSGSPNAIYAAAGYDPSTKMFGASTYDPTNPQFQVAGTGTGVLERFVGVRFFLQASLEVAVTRSSNFFAQIEGAPFQGERQSYTDKFNRIFPIQDLPLYGRLGFTLKF